MFGFLGLKKVGKNNMSSIQSIVFGGGCFWCTEAVFKQLKGVINVTPGYAGGEVSNPSYEQVCSGNTGHAEVIKVDFDILKISLETLLEVFFSVHDPTTLNRQGHDVGTQYRSIVLFNSKEQEMSVNTKIDQIKKDNIFSKPIVTEVVPLVNFFEAEGYHHDYFKKNPNQTYCQLVINPKLKTFKDKWKLLLN